MCLYTGLDTCKGYFLKSFNSKSNNVNMFERIALGEGYSKCHYLRTKTIVSIRGPDSFRGLCVFVLESTVNRQRLLTRISFFTAVNTTPIFTKKLPDIIQLRKCGQATMKESILLNPGSE